MNLQALYNLKEQLENLAAAGTSIQDSDFRLQKSLDFLSPLAAVSPVFSKIVDETKKFLQAVPEQRGYILIDLLALINAVVYTQGSFGCSGEPVKLDAKPGKYLELSCSKLKSILDLLNSSGNGRLTQLQNIWIVHPEYFSDYRVIDQLIRSLDESYADLGKLYVNILYKQLKRGNFSPKFLRDNFDQVSKRAMLRRLQLIAAAGTENEWLSNLLPQTKKDLRAAVIIALGGNKINLPILLKLLKTEKSKNRQAVLKALAHIDTYETKELWETELENNPTETISLFEGSNTPLIIELTAQFFNKVINQLYCNYSKENDNLLSSCLNSVLGKWSPDIQKAWYLAAELTQCKTSLLFNLSDSDINRSLTAQLASALAKSVIINPSHRAQETAQLLAQQNRDYFAAHFTAEVLNLPSEVLYNKYSGSIARRKLFFAMENKEQEQMRLQITAVISWIYHNSLYNCDAIAYTCKNSLADISTEEFRPINKLDIRWLKLLTDPKVKRAESNLSYFVDIPTVGHMSYSLEQIMAALIDESDLERCEIIGNFLYQSARKEPKLWKRDRYLKYLKRCGFNESILNELMQM